MAATAASGRANVPFHPRSRYDEIGNARWQSGSPSPSTCRQAPDRSASHFSDAASLPASIAGTCSPSGGQIACSYASRDGAKAEAYRRQFRGVGSYRDYAEAIDDPAVDAVVVAVPPRFHLDLTLAGARRGQARARREAGVSDRWWITSRCGRRGTAPARVVLVGENDHYKPLAVTLRRLLADGVIGEMVFAHFMTIARRLKPADDWRNDETMAGGDAFFEEGIHWLHVAGSLGPRIRRIDGYRPAPSREGPDTRVKSMMVAFRYDNDAVGSLYYSREIPSLFSGLRVSKLFGRKGMITFESNGSFVIVRGAGVPRLLFPGSATFAATGRCTGIFSAPSGTGAPRK